MNKKCENCKYYKPSILIPCQGKCKVARVKRNWGSKSCQFFEEREYKLKADKVRGSVRQTWQI